MFVIMRHLQTFLLERNLSGLPSLDRTERTSASVIDPSDMAVFIDAARGTGVGGMTAGGKEEEGKGACVAQ